MGRSCSACRGTLALQYVLSASGFRPMGMGWRHPRHQLSKSSCRGTASIGQPHKQPSCVLLECASLYLMPHCLESAPDWSFWQRGLFIPRDHSSLVADWSRWAHRLTSNQSESPRWASFFSGILYNCTAQSTAQELFAFDPPGNQCRNWA